MRCMIYICSLFLYINKVLTVEECKTICWREGKQKRVDKNKIIRLGKR